jgi:protoporphyrinogen oxidase
MQRIDALLQPHQGLFLTGNSYRGVSINACIADAPAVADAALRAVGRPPLVQEGAMTA